MKRVPDNTPLIMLGFVMSLIVLVFVAGQLAWGMEQVTVYGKAEGAPWYVMLAIICGPGLGAILLTIATVIMIRRINRADGRKPLSVLNSVLWTLGAGAAWGPLLQWGLQEMVYTLTGIAPNFKLIVLSPFVTGPASLIAYDVLRAYTKTRYKGVYALLSVKHWSAAGHAGGNGDDGDLTYYQAQGSDDTIPRD